MDLKKELPTMIIVAGSVVVFGLGIFSAGVYYSNKVKTLDTENRKLAAEIKARDEIIRVRQVSSEGLTASYNRNKELRAINESLRARINNMIRILEQNRLPVPKE